MRSATKSHFEKVHKLRSLIKSLNRNEFILYMKHDSSYKGVIWNNNIQYLQVGLMNNKTIYKVIIFHDKLYNKN